eukprot:TRINITY_DN698_c0_g1_i2.p1 TRINITY_DN698_c0_g1~~TRINITY_DN698_c0_g1_i2.p1  ORF type:complete len:1300 (+),score=335.10 TRINITY_DN698_c0_g1_i2:220-4119(+)
MTLLLIFKPYPDRVSFKWKSEPIQIIREWTQYLDLNAALEKISFNTNVKIPRLVSSTPLFRSSRDPVVVAERTQLLLQWFNSLLETNSVQLKVFESFLSTRNNPIYFKSLHDPEKEGFLTKEGHIIKTWKRRWFVLKGDTLFYFTSQDCTQLAGLIRLVGVSVRPAPEKQREFCFTIRPVSSVNTQSPYYMVASNLNEHNQWVNVLSAKAETLSFKPDEKVTTTSVLVQRSSVINDSDSKIDDSTIPTLDFKPRVINWNDNIVEGSLKLAQLILDQKQNKGSTTSFHHGYDHSSIQHFGNTHRKRANTIDACQHLKLYISHPKAQLRSDSPQVSRISNDNTPTMGTSHSQQHNPVTSSGGKSKRSRVGLSKLKEQTNLDLMDFLEDLNQLRNKLKSVTVTLATSQLFFEQMEKNHETINVLQSITTTIIDSYVEDFFKEPEKARQITAEIMGLYKKKQSVEKANVSPAYITRLLFIFSKFTRILEYYSSRKSKVYSDQVESVDDTFIKYTRHSSQSRNRVASEPSLLKTSDKYKKVHSNQTSSSSSELDIIKGKINSSNDPAYSTDEMGEKKDVKSVFINEEEFVFLDNYPPSPGSSSSSSSSSAKPDKKSERFQDLGLSRSNVQTPSNRWKANFPWLFAPSNTTGGVGGVGVGVVVGDTTPKTQSTPTSSANSSSSSLTNVASSGQEIVVCRICEEKFKKADLILHGPYCAITQKCDIASQSCDIRLHKLIDVMRTTQTTGTAAEISKEVKEILLQMEKIACRASEVGMKEIQTGATRLENYLAEVDTIMSDYCDHVVVLTFAKKLTQIICEKFSSITEYSLIAKEAPIPEADPTIIPSTETPNNTNTSNNNSTVRSKLAGFLNLFSRKTKPSSTSSPVSKSSSTNKNNSNNNNNALSNPLKISIKDFQILKPISRGAFGRVYLAKKIKTGDLYAIKVMRKSDIIRKNQQGTVITERNAMARAHHPFIVQLYFAFQSEKYLYLVMEYLIGGDLASLLHNMSYFDEPMVKRYTAEIVLALEYLHSIGIVHRDLKPDNLLIGHDGHLKMTDFGLSKIGMFNNESEVRTDRCDPLRDLAASGGAKESDDRIVGTPDYLSPEILLGTGHGTGVDWWAVGVMTFEMLVGCPPFADSTPEAIFQNILNRAMFDWPNTINISDSAKDFVESLLVLDPTKRLGAKGVDEIKNHPFFQGTVWDSVFTTPMADIFIPEARDAQDTSNFLQPESSDGSSFGSSFTSFTSDKNSNQQMNSPDSMDMEDIPDFSFKNLAFLREKNKEILYSNPEYEGDYSSDDDKCLSEDK